MSNEQFAFSQVFDPNCNLYYVLVVHIIGIQLIEILKHLSWTSFQFWHNLIFQDVCFCDVEGLLCFCLNGSRPPVEEHHSGLRERWKHCRLRCRKFYFCRLFQNYVCSIFTIRTGNSFCLKYGNMLRWLGVSNMQNRSSVLPTGDPSNSICRVKVDTLARRNIAAAGNNTETETRRNRITETL